MWPLKRQDPATTAACLSFSPPAAASAHYAMFHAPSFLPPFQDAVVSIDKHRGKKKIQHNGRTPTTHGGAATATAPSQPTNPTIRPSAERALFERERATMMEDGGVLSVGKSSGRDHMRRMRPRTKGTKRCAWIPRTAGIQPPALNSKLATSTPSSALIVSFRRLLSHPRPLP